jgi:REP element-mobilizing transposase RayT
VEPTHQTAVPMPQSLSKVYVHLMFSTKYREPVLHKEIQPELYSYLGGICNAWDCAPVKVGGYYDHVHILCRLSRKIALMKLLEEVKKSSSKWMKTKGSEFAGFYWQDGYGAFSVNPTQLNTVVKYIETQDEHHSKKDFQNEFRAFLKKYQVEYDERYVWD